MRFGRNRNPFERRGSVDRLVGRARDRLAVFTLLLVIALVSAAGLITAAAAVRAMDASVDQTLRELAAAVMTQLMPESDASTPGPGDSTEPNETAGDGSESDEHARATASPRPSPRPQPPEPTRRPARTDRPTPTPTREPTDRPGDGRTERPATPEPTDPAAEPHERGDASGVTWPLRALRAGTGAGAVAGSATTAPASPGVSPLPSPFSTDERIPASADTFFLILDPSGGLVANPQNVALRGLPDIAAVTAAQQRGEDIRTSTVDGTPIRLLTQPIEGADHVVRGYLQSAIVLSLLHAQQADLWQTVLLVTLVGVLGATAVTLLVTHRALSPIRQAFATERRFVAAASHELRTPIAVIRASAEILDREHLVDPAGQRFVGDVISESDRLARQVADLLTLSSLYAGALSITPRPVELRPFLEAVAGRAATMASSHEVTIAVESGAAAPTVAEIDPERLEQLLMIFVDNAVDHSPAHGVVRLALDGRAGSSGTATISVIDQGPGIPPRERARIFEPFARLPRRRRTGESTGLGLAIARTLAERLRASIAIGDAPGGGAVFSVTFRTANSSLRAGRRLRFVHR